MLPFATALKRMIQVDMRGATFQSELGDKLFALYQGTTSVVPPPAKMVRALAPAPVKSAGNSKGKTRRG
jgi:hypothetical protein